jgi:sec-independent protein translocase protein TatA
VFGLGGTELVLILVLIVLFFGARKLPAFARGLGEGIRNFKGAIRGQNGDPRPPELPGEEDRQDR